MSQSRDQLQQQITELQKIDPSDRTAEQQKELADLEHDLANLEQGEEKAGASCSD